MTNANAALAPLNAQIREATKRLASSPVDSPAAAEAGATLRRLCSGTVSPGPSVGAVRPLRRGLQIPLEVDT